MTKFKRPAPTTYRGQQLTKSDIQQDYILLDGSGSMSPQWLDMLDAIQTYVDGLKTANVNSQLTLHVFDSTDIDLVHRSCIGINDWKSLRDEPIDSHFGGTPLYDAINLMGRRLRDLDPPKAAITIVTDGQDTGSATDLVQAKAILNWLRAKGYQITFIGANFNNSEQAGLLGASAESAIGVERRHLSDATANLARKRAAYGTTGAPMHWSKSEQQQFGGYLASK